MKRYIPITLLAFIIVFGYSVSHAAITVVTDESIWHDSIGSWKIADFEGFIGPIENRYTNLTFYDYNGGSPFSIEQFPYEGSNSMFTVFRPSGGGGGFAVDFGTPLNGVAFWAGDVQFVGTIISLYDSSKNLLGEYDLLNDGSGYGPEIYGFNGFISDNEDISRIELSIDSEDAVWFDNFQYNPVPIPSSIVLLFSGIMGLASLRKKKLNTY